MSQVNVSLPDFTSVQSSRFAELLFVQKRDSDAIPAYNFGRVNETATFTANRSYPLGDQPRLAGTYFDAVTDPFAGIRVGCQVNGSDITISERGSDGISEWSVPIYDDE